MGVTLRLSWNLRVATGDQKLIDLAVSASGLTRTHFLLQAAGAAAEELLVGQAWSAMAPEAYEALAGGMGLQAPQPHEQHHSIIGFDCGDDRLNPWLQHRALGNQRNMPDPIPVVLAHLNPVIGSPNPPHRAAGRGRLPAAPPPARWLAVGCGARWHSSGAKSDPGGAQFAPWPVRWWCRPAG